jgi:hypothetical protein
MSSDEEEIAQSKRQIIRDSLERVFKDVKFRGDIRPMFVFNNGKGRQSWQLIFNQKFLADRIPLEKLQRFVEDKVIPKVLGNPGKRIQISQYGDITVEEKLPS